MSGSDRYLLDANSFIRSKREHYAFDFCPAYWDALLKGFRDGRLLSIQPVRQELARGKDALAAWVKDHTPTEMFSATDDSPVLNAYASILNWVEGNEQYSRAAKQTFASGADPWLVAFASANACQIVTYEVSSPNSKALVKLPDVAPASSK